MLRGLVARFAAAPAVRTTGAVRCFSSTLCIQRPGCAVSSHSPRQPSRGRLTPTVEHSCDLGRGHLGKSQAFSTKRELPANVAPSFAFAFDIDGVLLHVAKPIPGAAETLRYLDAHNIPFILLTNGGGKLEAERVADLSDKLGVPLNKDSFVQSHTPFQQLVDGPESLKHKNILVTGANAEKCRHIAEHYGFQSVITPADILVAEPRVWPFEPLMEELYRATARPLPAPVYRPGQGVGAPTPSTALKIDAMFVFNDPRDWALDIQLLTDLLLSDSGYLGTYSARNGDASLPNEGWQQHNQPPLFFSNADLFWSTGFHLPRFGQGAFQAAVSGVWHRITGGVELKRQVIGKPYGRTYQYAERVLRQHRHDIIARQGHVGESPQLTTVYMVGDNPESDIAGANGYSGQNGTAWNGLLVRTGVWSPERGGAKALEGHFRPTVIVDDVRDAVTWALEKEGWKGEGVL